VVVLGGVVEWAVTVPTPSVIVPADLGVFAAAVPPDATVLLGLQGVVAVVVTWRGRAGCDSAAKRP